MHWQVVVELMSPTPQSVGTDLVEAQLMVVEAGQKPVRPVAGSVPISMMLPAPGHGPSEANGTHPQLDAQYHGPPFGHWQVSMQSPGVPIAYAQNGAGVVGGQGSVICGCAAGQSGGRRPTDQRPFASHSANPWPALVSHTH
jgi:hypothetical protein